MPWTQCLTPGVNPRALTSAAPAVTARIGRAWRERLWQSAVTAKPALRLQIAGIVLASIPPASLVNQSEPVNQLEVEWT